MADYNLLKWSVETTPCPTQLLLMKANALSKINYLISIPNDEMLHIKHFAAKTRMLEFYQAISNTTLPNKKVSTEIMDSYNRQMENEFGDMHTTGSVQIMKIVCLNCINIDFNNNKQCAKCKKVSYCSKSCQTADWPFHKHACSS